MIKDRFEFQTINLGQRVSCVSDWRLKQCLKREVASQIDCVVRLCCQINMQMSTKLTRRVIDIYGPGGQGCIG